MTYTELTSRMTSAELELWMALETVRQRECPNCGVAADQFMEHTHLKVKCPVCKHEYARIRREFGKRRKKKE